MYTLSLDGKWFLYRVQPGTVHTPDELHQAGILPVPAIVPGNVEVDLMKAGRLPDPFVGSNIHQLRELEFMEWWYEHHFNLPVELAGSLRLSFEGLDTLATVWVNGQEVGRSANMLIPHSFDVTRVLVPGQENELVVRLEAALLWAQQIDYDAGTMSWEHRSEGLYLRKAPHVWGWDILPRAVSAGLWRSVSIQAVPETDIEQLYYYTITADPQQAILGAWFQVRIGDKLNLDGLVMHFHGICQEAEDPSVPKRAPAIFEYEWPLEFITDACQITIPQPALWWPVGYGEPDLYRVTAQLRRGEQVLAERVDRVGIRKLVVDRTELAGQAWALEPADTVPGRVDAPPDPGSHFVIYVNDTPIMVKGTNWVPLDALHSRDAERLPKVLELAADLQLNMIRCWGGNVYESDDFFDWCDAHGVLVWQDFAFACCLYPQSDEFLAEVRHEVEVISRRLRNHACLALWCGDNEIDMAYLSQGRDPQRNHLTREIIPQVLERTDPYREFIPSSPYVPPAVANRPNAWQATPEQHLWGPRGYYKSTFYTRHSAHFIGEIGYHGCPNVASIEKFITPEHRWFGKDFDRLYHDEEWQVHAVYHWRHHAIDRDRIKLMANQVRELFGIIPDDLSTFTLASQVVQAEAVKFFVEATRLRKWQTSGILWWNLIDGWPQFSDAVVDYYFGKKLAYHYLWRVQQPVLLSIGEAGTGKYLPIIASNDTRQEAQVHFRVWEAGQIATLYEDDFYLPANQNWQVGRLRTYASEQRLYLIEWRVSGVSTPNRPPITLGNHYLAGSPPFDLAQYRLWLPEIAKLQRPFEPHPPVK